MNEINIKIDDFEAEYILDKVAERMAGIMYRDFDTSVVKKTLDKFDEMIKAQAETKIIETLSKPTIQTDVYGNPRPGVALMTMAEMIGQKFEQYLKESVDSRGSYCNYSSGMKRLDWLIDSVIGKELKPKIDAAIEDVKKKSEARVSAAITAIVQDYMKKESAK